MRHSSVSHATFAGMSVSHGAFYYFFFCICSAGKVFLVSRPFTWITSLFGIILVLSQGESRKRSWSHCSRLHWLRFWPYWQPWDGSRPFRLSMHSAHFMFH